MKRSWYTRMLFSYFPVFLLVVTVLIFLAFMVITELSRSETEKANYISTRYVADTVERTLNDIELGVLQEIGNNYSYNDFLDAPSGTDSPAGSSYEIVQSMNRLSERFSLIDSIYVYRNKDKLMLGQSGYVNPGQGQGLEAEYLQQLSANKQQQGWSAVRMVQPRNSQDLRPVISQASRLPIPWGSDGYIVINVSVYRIERLVDSLTSGELSFLRIKDVSGTPIYDSAPAADGQNNRTLSKVEAKNLGWTFESGLRAGRLFDWISVISYIWFILGLLTIALGIVYIIYITRRNYRPIHQLMVRIQGLQPAAQNAAPAVASDELALMHNALDRLVQITTDYERERYENLVIQRRELFQDFLSGQRLEDAAERLESLDPFEGTREFEAFVVFAAELNREKDWHALPAQDQNLLKFALTNVLGDLMADRQLQAWAEWISGERLGMIIGFRFQPVKDDSDTMLELARDCHRWIMDNLRVSLTFGVGPVVRGWREIKNSYAAAAEVLSHRLALGTDIAAVHMVDGRDDSGLQSYKYFGSFTQLVREFRLSGENWRIRLDEIFDSFRKDRLKDEEIYMLLEVLLQALEQELKGIAETLDRQLAAAWSGGLRERIRGSTDLEEIRELLTGWLNETYHVYVSVNELKSHRVMITEVKHYIEEHYANPDLSLNHLSERFQISAKYASYLFKEEFNMKFVDFLAEQRLMKAKELLETTSESIQDIALQIGYANSITFGRVFKRITGMTPGDYRKSKLHKDE